MFSIHFIQCKSCIVNRCPSGVSHYQDRDWVGDVKTVP